MNKGVVVAVLPDDEMPRDLNGKVFDIIINPDGINSRKNIGQLIELYLGKIVHKVNVNVKQLIDGNKYSQVIDELIKMYKLIQPNTPHSNRIIQRLEFVKKNKKILEEFILMLNESKVQYITDPIVPISIKNIIKAMLHYNIKTKEKIYDPSIGSNTKKPVTFGYMYWEKTVHLASKKLHARSIGPVQGSTLQAARGSKNEGGQRIDELSVAILASYGVENYLTEISSLSSDDIKSKSKAILQIYKNGKVSLNELRNSLISTSTEQFKTILKSMGVVDYED